MQLGRNQEARSAFDRAISLAGSAQEAAHIRRHLDRLMQQAEKFLKAMSAGGRPAVLGAHQPKEIVMAEQPDTPPNAVKGGVVAYLCVDGAIKAGEFYKKAFAAEAGASSIRRTTRAAPCMCISTSMALR